MIFKAYCIHWDSRVSAPTADSFAGKAMPKYGQRPATDGLVAHGISMYKYNYMRSVILLERSYNLLASYFLLLNRISCHGYKCSPTGLKHRYIFRQHSNMNSDPVKIRRDNETVMILLMIESLFSMMNDEQYPFV